MTGLRFAALVGLAAAVAFAPAAKAADAVADFYRGKTIEVIVGYSAGGGYDIYARTLARHMGRHIPGHPTLVTQNMPGAGSVKAANYLYNVAPKDGTVFGTFARGIPMERLLGRSRGERFDATKFTWIGSVTSETSVCVFWHASGIRTWHDMETKAFTLGGAGASSDLDMFANVLRNIFHLRLRLITGFPGGADVILALERGEIDGRCGWSWSSLMSRDKALYETKQVYVPLQLALKRNDELPGVPLILDLTKDAKEKAALKLLFSRQTMARPFTAPPDLPPARAQALRAAFDATMKDPDFLSEARKLDLEVHPVGGAEVEDLVKELYRSPPEVVKLATEAIKSAP